MDEEKSEMLIDSRAQPEEEATLSTETPAYKPGAKAPLSKKAFWRVLISLELCMFAIALDFYSTPVAVPSLSSFGLGYTNSPLLGTAFLASFALGLLIWPRLCKGFGYKFSFVVAIEAFNIASVHAAKPPTTERLIPLRLVAGAGAGAACGLFEVILRDIVPPKEFGKYMSVSWAIWAVTAVASPLMGGALVEYALPRLCFDLHFFPGQIGYLMVLFFLNLPEPSWSELKSNFREFDSVGTIYITLATAVFLIVTGSSGTLFSEFAEHAVVLSITGLAFLMAFFMIEFSAPDPLVHPSLFYNPNLLMILLAAFFYGANLVGTMYNVPQFFQVVLQDNAMISAVSALPMMLGMGLGTIASLFITSRSRTSFNTARFGAALLAVASGLMVRWGTHTSRTETTVVLAVLGLGQGAAMISLLRAAQASVSQHAESYVARLFAFFQASGHTFGVACFAALYTKRLRSSLAVLMLDVDETLANMNEVEATHGADVLHRILDACGSSMRSGWWFMFTCALTVLVLIVKVEQRQAQNEVDLSTVDDGKSIAEVERGSGLLEKSSSI